MTSALRRHSHDTLGTADKAHPPRPAPPRPAPPRPAAPRERAGPDLVAARTCEQRCSSALVTRSVEENTASVTPALRHSAHDTLDVVAERGGGPSPARVITSRTPSPRVCRSQRPDRTRGVRVNDLSAVLLPDGRGRRRAVRAHRHPAPMRRLAGNGRLHLHRVRPETAPDHDRTSLLSNSAGRGWTGLADSTV
ncbi:hypothetical protein ACFPM0_10960 [Pseudonocardia sulfidoxydans]|uniref:hypothetical protein n=1 Tax=Pseudonocardia sulfidoxydans TaxID=54011 RepID=UPI003621F9A2